MVWESKRTGGIEGGLRSWAATSSLCQGNRNGNRESRGAGEEPWGKDMKWKTTRQLLGLQELWQ